MISDLIHIPGVGTISFSALEQARNRDRYVQDPVLWAQEKLGEFLWSGQRRMMYSVRDHRRTAIYSCHRIGKSMCMARVAFWWLDTHLPGEAIVVTSAHSAMQVKMALWREMGRVHAKGKFVGRMNQTEYYMPMPDGREEMVAFGRKPEDSDTTGFQGTYAKRVLALGDEACYISDALITGLETLVSNEYSKIVLFGNPDDNTTRFAKICKPGSGWSILRFGYLNTPNFIDHPDYEGLEEDREIDSQCPQEVRDNLISRTWVAERAKDWGVESPRYTSKVEGKYPKSNSGGLFSVQWIQAAQDRELKPSESDIIELGVDVGGGSAANTIAMRRGGVVRIVHKDYNPDTMATLSAVLRVLRLEGISSEHAIALDLSTANRDLVKCAKVDYIGIGHGAVDRAREMASDHQIKRETPLRAQDAAKILPVEVGRTAKDSEHYVNLRAEGYWNLRENRFESGAIDIDPLDDALASQAGAIRYKAVSGRVQIESKKEMKDRGVASPDDLDSVTLAFMDIEEEKEYYTW